MLKTQVYVKRFIGWFQRSICTISIFLGGYVQWKIYFFGLTVKCVESFFGLRGNIVKPNQ